MSSFELRLTAPTTWIFSIFGTGALAGAVLAGAGGVAAGASVRVGASTCATIRRTSRFSTLTLPGVAGSAHETWTCLSSGVGRGRGEGCHNQPAATRLVSRT